MACPYSSPGHVHNGRASQPRGPTSCPSVCANMFLSAACLPEPSNAIILSGQLTSPDQCTKTLLALTTFPHHPKVTVDPTDKNPFLAHSPWCGWGQGGLCTQFFVSQLEKVVIQTKSLRNGLTENESSPSLNILFFEPLQVHKP